MIGFERLRLQQPVTKKRVIELACSNWFSALMQKCQWAGLTIVLPGIAFIVYWMPAASVNPYLRVHEYVHVRQDERNCCFFVTWLKYGWQWFLWGYRNNRYEREARLVELQAEESGLPGWAQ